MNERQKTAAGLTPTRGLRLALTVLYTGGDRRPFDEFWTLATERVGAEREVEASAFGRFQTMRACMAAISRANGVEYY